VPGAIKDSVTEFAVCPGEVSPVGAAGTGNVVVTRIGLVGEPLPLALDA